LDDRPYPQPGRPADPRLDDADRAIEALVMVADQPVEPSVLAQVLEIPVAEVERRCTALAAQYAADGRGFQLARVAGGYRYQSHPDQVAYVERYVLDGQSVKLSAAALETLAIVAYKQPVSRAQVTSIRGVNVDGVMRTLVQRGFVTEVGHDPGPGQAVLYGTTPLFLERLGLDTIDDLPPLGQFVPGGDVVETLERTLLAEGDPRRRTRVAVADPAGISTDLDPGDLDGGDLDGGDLDGGRLHPGGPDRRRPDTGVPVSPAAFIDLTDGEHHRPDIDLTDTSGEG
jgi:segregation and condensation protein B